jgi:hypothetical protein
MQQILELLLDNLEFIVVTIAGIVGRFIYKNNIDKADAIASLKSGVAAFFQDNPQIKTALSDGKISKDEWKILFSTVGPVAVGAATRGGAKVLKRWIDNGSVANKYIEAVARELSSEFGNTSS